MYIAPMVPVATAGGWGVGGGIGCRYYSRWYTISKSSKYAGLR